ncbi:hypothetical protein ACT7DC_09480 [Bacillus cereus]
MDTHQDAQLVKDTIQQVRNVYGSHKKILFHSDQDPSLPVIQLLIFVSDKRFNKVCPARGTVGIML